MYRLTQSNQILSIACVHNVSKDYILHNVYSYISIESVVIAYAILRGCRFM
jgi:hypothetical protein